MVWWTLPLIEGSLCPNSEQWHNFVDCLLTYATLGQLEVTVATQLWAHSNSGDNSSL